METRRAVMMMGTACLIVWVIALPTNSLIALVAVRRSFQQASHVEMMMVTACLIVLPIALLTNLQIALVVVRVSFHLHKTCLSEVVFVQTGLA